MPPDHSVAERRASAPDDATAFLASMTALLARVRGEYREMPGLRLTIPQAARLFGIPREVAGTVLHELRRASVLAVSGDGTYSVERML